MLEWLLDVRWSPYVVGIGIGERLNEDGVDKAEDGRVCPDPQAEAHDRGQSQAGPPGEEAKGLAEVVVESPHESSRFLVPVVWFRPVG